MRNIFNIALWKTKWQLKAKSSWVNMFILPVVFALIFGGMQSDNQGDDKDYLVKVGMVHSSTAVSIELLEEIIGKQLNADIVLFEDSQQANTAMKNGAINAVVLWDDYFEETWSKQEKTSFSFLYEKQTAENFMMEQQMNQLIIGLNAIPMMGYDKTLSAAEQVEQWLNTWQNYSSTMVSVAIQYGEQESTDSSFSRMFVGFSLMFLMFTLNQSASTILEEKEAGTWNRMLTAPLDKNQLIFGNILHFLLMGLIQFIVLMQFSRIVFAVNWGHYFDTLLFVALVILTVSGLGFMMATFVKSKVQQNIIGAVVITVTSMLGGVYWPLSIVSEFMRKLADFVPQKWAMDGLSQLMSGGYRLFDVTKPIYILLIFLAIFYLIGFIRVRKI